MKNKYCISVLITLLGILLSMPAYAVSITAFDTAEAMAGYIMGPGVAISNASYTGADGASGYFSFTEQENGIGVDSGIILTSGSASYAAGGGYSRNNYSGSDSDLNALIGSNTTHDAAVLEFDFVSTSEALAFDYVFASFEFTVDPYPFYNDVFGLFITGNNSGAPLISGNESVAVDTFAYPAWSWNNPLNPSVSIAYSGYTDVLTASITNLTINETYHLKLAIADEQDGTIDSGVFIKGYVPPANPVPEPATLILLGCGLLGLAGYRKRKK